MGSPDAPPPRNLTKELMQIYKGTAGTAPGYLGLTQQYAPLFSDLYYQQASRNAPRFTQLALSQEQRAIAGQPLLRSLNQQAQAQLDTGGRLTPQMQRLVDQQTRGAFAARGMAYSNPALVTEFLNRDIYSQQRLAQAQQFAQNVQNQNLASYNTFGQSGPTPFGAIAQGTQVWSPNSQYAQDLFNTNYNAQAASNIASANKTNSYLQGSLNAAASVGAAY